MSRSNGSCFLAGHHIPEDIFSENVSKKKLSKQFTRKIPYGINLYGGIRFSHFFFREAEKKTKTFQNNLWRKSLINLWGKIPYKIYLTKCFFFREAEKKTFQNNLRRKSVIKIITQNFFHLYLRLRVVLRTR